MKKFIPVVLLICCIGCSNMKKSESGHPTDLSPEQMQKAFEKASTPTAQHSSLNALVGHYTTETKMWMKPGADAEVTPGTADFSWALDGRFIDQKFTGSMMGKPFTGGGLIGFDTVAEKYQSTWQDSMSTQIMYSEGSADQSGRVITFRGDFSCPMSDSKKLSSKSVLTVGTDTHLYEMFVPGPDGKEYKTLEVTYVKAKPKKVSAKTKHAKGKKK
jgi:hypothetical protein